MIQNIMAKRADIALLITRLIIGGIFIYAGWMKVIDLGMTVSQFQMMNIPAFLTYIVSFGELIGGILLILGLWPVLVTFFLLIIMLVAVFLTFGMGFAMYGMPLAMIAGIVALHGCGVGRFKIPNTKFN